MAQSALFSSPLSHLSNPAPSALHHKAQIGKSSLSPAFRPSLQPLSCGSRLLVGRVLARKGFGPAPPKKKSQKSKSDQLQTPSKREEEEEDEDWEDDVVPEIVTDRMLKRGALTVGVPLAVAVLFFPFFYYLKQIKHVDLPNWVPLITSMVTFGAAGLGISYAVLSASWDPDREGTLLGWKEAKANWPVLWQTFKQDPKERKRRRK